MPFVIAKADGTRMEAAVSPNQKENVQMAELEKSNEIEIPAQPAERGERIANTNPIEPVVVYSDAPGAGPVGAPNAPKAGAKKAEVEAQAADANEEDADADREAQVREQPKQGKAVAGPPENKAVSNKESK